mgnify:CR=1 FL=1
MEVKDRDTMVAENASNMTTNLISAIGSQTATKSKIEELANECANAVEDPLETVLKLKPVMDFLAKFKELLSGEALDEANTIPESKRRLQNLTYEVVNRKTYKFDDETLKELEFRVKARKEYLTEQGEGKLTTTSYIRINIPKE